MTMNPFFEDIVIEMSGQGPTGKTGNSIANIEKTSSSGLVDTYTITMTWGQTYTFTVENGNGIESITKTSTDVLTDTYTIQYTNGTSTTFEVVNGNGIANIAKTSADVLSDTYTITYTNGTTTTYTVTNGKGIVGIEKTSTVGLVDIYTITYNDGTTSTYTVMNGEKGDTGNGIESITKTGTSGLVDTYTILYTNGQTTTYTVTNGNGISGISKTGTSGLTDTYTISFTNGTSTTFQVVNGNGIASIAKTSTVDLVDTYTITYTNGTTSTYTVTNGEKGDTGNGIASIEKTATVGAVDTYTITYTNGTTTTFDVTNGSDEWGAIVGNLSDQTDLQAALDSKAPAITETASGSIASFTDGSPAPVTALSVAIEPVQDLHDYDNPWPAGGGKNLFGPTDITLGTRSWTVDSNGYIKYSSTTDGRTYNYSNCQWTINLTAGTYYVYGESSNKPTSDSVFKVIKSDGNTLKTISLSNNESVSNSFTISEDQTVGILIKIVNESASSPHNYRFVIASESVSSWIPYSNICPISGWTSSIVSIAGKNLINSASFEEGSYIDDNGVEQSSTTAKTSGLITVKPNLDYTFSGTQVYSSYHNKRIHAYDANGNWISQLFSGSKGSGIYTISVTTPSNACYLRFCVYKTDTDLQLEFGTSTSTYEPYQGTSVTIDLDGTRYGGMLDVLTGEMTVTHKLETFDGSDDETWDFYAIADGNLFRISVLDRKSENISISSSGYYCNEFTKAVSQRTNGSFSGYGYAVDFIYDNCSSKAEWRTWLSSNPIQFVYPLATPFTVQLDASTLETLKGENHIWASTGDVAVTYRADTKLFIQEQIAESETMTRKMIADIAVGDLAPKTLAVDELVIVGDELRKATESIGQGSAITSLNSTTANLADVIKALQ